MLHKTFIRSAEFLPEHKPTIKIAYQVVPLKKGPPVGVSNPSASLQKANVYAFELV